MLGGKQVNARAYASWFNFTGGDQQKKAGVLSGGERNRLHLARIVKSEANVLLLDEPTNDLDVNTLRALEDALDDFAGCAVVISHDRWFLDRIATHILAFEGESRVYLVRGQLFGLRGRPPPPPGARGRPAAPHPLPQTHALTPPRPQRRRRGSGQAFDEHPAPLVLPGRVVLPLPAHVLVGFQLGI